MYARSFRKADHTRRFTIDDAGSTGWIVKEEQDSRIVRTAQYDDWHRVERARHTFALAAQQLSESGWDESAD